MSAFVALRRRLHDAWEARAPRERRALLLAAIVIAVAAWMQLLWVAAERRERLQQQIQRLEYRTALARTLAARIAIAPAAGDTAAPIGVPLVFPPPAGLSIQTSGNRYQISGTVPFDAWVAWLGQLQHGPHVVLALARVRKSGAPGMVEVEGELERTP